MVMPACRSGAAGRVLSPTTDRQRLLGFARRWLYEHRLLVPRERDLRVMIHKAVRSH